MKRKILLNINQPSDTHRVGPLLILSIINSFSIKLACRYLQLFLFIILTAFQSYPVHSNSIVISQNSVTSVSNGEGANKQRETNTNHNQLSKTELLQIFKENPKYISEQYKDSILKGIVQIGMNPYEARLAGGAYFYSIKIDYDVWPEGIVPLQVIDHQAIKADNSEIKMTFENKTQFGGAVERRFVVRVEKGKVISITKSTN